MATRMPVSAFGLCLSTSHKLKTNKNRMQLHMKTGNEKRYKTRIMSSMTIGDSYMTPALTPKQTIEEFYKCLNEKNVKQVENYLTDDCLSEDYTSSDLAYVGKKEVVRFHEKLIKGLGPNVKFRVSGVFEADNLDEADDDLIAGALWHLEWKNKEVPFTSGAGFYKLAKDGQRLKIRNAYVVFESPIRARGLFLGLLKILTSLFDVFPKVTEWFFTGYKVIVQVLLKIYSIFVVPFVRPSPIVFFKKHVMSSAAQTTPNMPLSKHSPSLSSTSPSPSQKPQETQPHSLSSLSSKKSQRTCIGDAIRRCIMWFYVNLIMQFVRIALKTLEWCATLLTKTEN